MVAADRAVLRRAVFLDRDGVINRTILRNGKPYPPASMTEFDLLPGVQEALARLAEAGFLLIVVTNQPDVGRGTQSRDVVDAFHARLMRELPLDDIRVCWDETDDAYKPKPGMVLTAASDLSIDLAGSYLVGDRWRDIDCARAANIGAIFIDHGYAEALRQPPDVVVRGLSEAADVILAWEAAPLEPVMESKTMTDIADINIKIFADGADLDAIQKLSAKPWVRGFTTNPTLMRKAGISDYKAFALEVLRIVPDRPVSFEVFANDQAGMERQALTIAGWGPNVNVKIPVTNTQGVFTGPLIRRLSEQGVIVNVTAICTLNQVRAVADALHPDTPAIISVFAGRIADTGVDPVPFMETARAILVAKAKSELLWASPRELLNVVQAARIGCHIITVTPEIISKLPLIGKNLDEYSLETVHMFDRDATAAGYTLDDEMVYAVSAV